VLPNGLFCDVTRLELPLPRHAGRVGRLTGRRSIGEEAWMHELAIAQAILERAQRASEKNGGGRVLKVGLRIGEISGVEADALSFGIEALSKGTPLEGLVLEIDQPKRRQRCTSCAAEFEPEGFTVRCPMCQHEASECIAGSELDVTFIELEDPPCA